MKVERKDIIYCNLGIFISLVISVFLTIIVSEDNFTETGISRSVTILIFIAIWSLMAWIVDIIYLSSIMKRIENLDRAIKRVEGENDK